jgi:hypothetical protein
MVARGVARGMQKRDATGDYSHARGCREYEKVGCYIVN